MGGYFVYILGNERGLFYTGVTNDLERRVFGHKGNLAKGFTHKYKIYRLLYIEEFGDVNEAIAAEKRIKGWVRKRKLDLIRTINPRFEDLSRDWGGG